MNAANLRVLIIDDDRHLCSALKSLLEHIAPIEVTTSETFAGGIRFADPDLFDVILLDLKFHSENIDGVDAIRRMREHLKAQGRGTIPIVAFSAENGEMQQHAMFAGAYAFILKPFESSKTIFDILVSAAAEHRSKRAVEPILRSMQRQDEALNEAKQDSVHLESPKPRPSRGGYLAVVTLVMLGAMLAAFLAGGSARERSLRVHDAQASGGSPEVPAGRFGQVDDKGGFALPIGSKVLESKDLTASTTSIPIGLDSKLAELRERPPLANVSRIDRCPPIPERRQEVLADGWEIRGYAAAFVPGTRPDTMVIALLWKANALAPESARSPVYATARAKLLEQNAARGKS